MYAISRYLWGGSVDTDIISHTTVAVAESVTAGALANTLCAEPGASEFFKGGIIAYDIQSKRNILHIDTDYAEKTNFANPFTTAEMAKSVAKMFNARIGMATTGYSLPTKRDADQRNGLCELNIINPYAYICIYDTATNSELIKKVTFTYRRNVSDILQRASVQTKVALEGRRMYMAKCIQISDAMDLRRA